jgi:hypothetical protein
MGDIQKEATTMNKEEQKEYIRKHWKLSSGEKIAEMLKRYWEVKKDLIKTAEDLFNGKAV